MLGLPSCTELDVVTLHCAVAVNDPRISSDRHPAVSTVEDLKRMYPNQFDRIGNLHGEAKLHVHQDAEPYIDAPRKWPIHLKERIKEELDKMEMDDVIKKVDIHTDWCSSLAFSTKVDGSIRICLDPARLNKSLKRCSHKIPTLEELNYRFKGAKFFSKLDAKTGYWSIRLDEPSQLLTTFRTPLGRYCFKRLPFGLSVSQDIFQQRMDSVLERCDGAIGIADDVAVYGKTEEEHHRNLIQLMQVAEQNGLVFNSKKCIIKQKQIAYFGMVYGVNGIQPDPKKISDIQGMPTPSCKQELQEFLGLIQYLAVFIQDLSNKAAPLRQLLKKEVPFMWESDHQHCFETLKTLVSTDATLQYYDVDAPVVLHVDASQRGLGAALLQPDETGKERPIAYASKSLSDAESRYANIERELLAVCFGVERFKTYVFGRSFKIVTDHKPLIMILNKNLTSAPPRLQRMMLKLQGYNFTIEYRPGSDMVLPDSLSRLPNPENTMTINLDVRVDMGYFATTKLAEIQQATQADPVLQQMIVVIVSGWPETIKEVPERLREYWSFRDELSVENGIILKGERVVIPEPLRQQILEKLHTGHLGIEKTKLRAKGIVYWPRINECIERLCRECQTCQSVLPEQQHETLLQHEIPIGPWETVGTDLFELDQFKYLIVADYYSKYPIVKKLPNHCPSSVIVSVMKQLFAEHGIPSKVISDNGLHYSSSQFKQFAEQWGFNHVTSSPRYPRSNGFIERQVRTVKSVLKKSKQSKTDIDMALLSLRTTPVDHHLPSPAEMLFWRSIRSNLPINIKNIRSNRDGIYDRLLQRQISQKAYHDRSVKDLTPLYPGQDVRVRDPSLGHWIPATVLNRRPEPRSYEIQAPSGSILRRNRQQIRAIPQAQRSDSPMARQSPPLRVKLRIVRPPLREPHLQPPTTHLTMRPNQRKYKSRAIGPGRVEQCADQTGSKNDLLG